MADNRTERTPKKERALLAKLSEGKSIVAACRAANVGRSTYYEWREKYPDFRQAADDAIEDGTDLLEDEAHERATRDENPSDTLLIFLLKARRRKKYGDHQSLEHAGPNGEALTIVFGERSDGPQ